MVFLILFHFAFSEKGKTGEAKSKDSKAADNKTTKTPGKSASSAKDKKETGKSLWVSNLSSVTRAADLKTRFSQYGKVRSEFVTNSKSFTVFSLNLAMTGKINFQTFGAILFLDQSKNSEQFFVVQEINITGYCLKRKALVSYLVNLIFEVVGLCTIFKTFPSEDLISNSPYCLPYNSFDVSSENLVLDQKIP